MAADALAELDELNTAPATQVPGVCDFLSLTAWANRDIPETDRLLGDLFTTTSRIFLVGSAGLGKTLLGMAIACGISAGQGFLHWRSVRPAKVLYIDGEMPSELIKARCLDLLRRMGDHPKPDNLVIFARDTEEEFVKRFPAIGEFAPLNTEPGQDFIRNLIAALGGVEVVVFDNVMSLLEGDQKDEVSWSGVLPLISDLTSKRIGQIWLDHTGHDRSRQYGSSTKGWRFDAIGVMTPFSDNLHQTREVAFQLSFDYPGKARRRTPDNWQDFEACIIRLHDDQWTSEPVNGERCIKQFGKVSPARRAFYDALVVAIGASAVRGEATMDEWEAQCVRRGLIEPPPEGEERESGQARDRRRRDFRKAKSDLVAAGWIAVQDHRVIDLKARWG